MKDRWVSTGDQQREPRGDSHRHQPQGEHEQRHEVRDGGGELPHNQLPACQRCRFTQLVGDRVLACEDGIVIGEQQQVGGAAGVPAAHVHLKREQPGRDPTRRKDRPPDRQRRPDVQQQREEHDREPQRQPSQHAPPIPGRRVLDVDGQRIVPGDGGCVRRRSSDPVGNQCDRVGIERLVGWARRGLEEVVEPVDDDDGGVGVALESGLRGGGVELGGGL